MVRVLSRLLRRARRLEGQVPSLAALKKEVFRTRTRACRQLAQQFRRLAPQKGADAIGAMKQTAISGESQALPLPAPSGSRPNRCAAVGFG